MRAKRNVITENIKQAKMKGESVDALMTEAKTLPDLIKASETKLKELEVSNKALLMNIPNILQDDVPYGKDGDDNVVLRTWGEAVKNPNLIHHGQLATKLNVADFERAVKIAGEGFYALKGDLALLNMAIVAYSIELLARGALV